MDDYADDQGSFSFSLWTEASDRPGQYIAYTYTTCADADAVFIIEP